MSKDDDAEPKASNGKSQDVTAFCHGCSSTSGRRRTRKRENVTHLKKSIMITKDGSVKIQKQAGGAVEKSLSTR